MRSVVEQWLVPTKESGFALTVGSRERHRIQFGFIAVLNTAMFVARNFEIDVSIVMNGLRLSSIDSVRIVERPIKPQKHSMWRRRADGNSGKIVTRLSISILNCPISQLRSF